MPLAHRPPPSAHVAAGGRCGPHAPTRRGPASWGLVGGRWPGGLSRRGQSELAAAGLTEARLRALAGDLAQ
jgi:hypothetical protein